MEIDRQKLTGYGKKGYRFALQAGLIYAVSIFIGLILGGAGGYWAAGYFSFGAFISFLSAVSGTVIGGIGGFFLGQLLVIGLIQDMLLEAGIRTGVKGVKAGLKLLKERQKDGKPGQL